MKSNQFIVLLLIIALLIVAALLWFNRTEDRADSSDISDIQFTCEPGTVLFNDSSPDFVEEYARQCGN